MFCFRPARPREIAQHAPDVLEAAGVLPRGAAHARRARLRRARRGELFAQCAERLDRLRGDGETGARRGRAGDIGWSDIGSWSAVGELPTPTRDGNRVAGERCCRRREQLLHAARSRLVAAVGVRRPDDRRHARRAARRAPSERAQDVQARRRARSRRRATRRIRLHRTVHRPWGTYTALEEGAALQDQAHRGQARSEPVAADAPPPQRALGGGQRHRQRDERRARDPRCTTSPRTSRSARSTAWRTRARWSS